MSDDICLWCNRPLVPDQVFEDRWGNVFDTRDCLRAYIIDMLGWKRIGNSMMPTIDLSRRLAELLEPKPPIPNDSDGALFDLFLVGNPHSSQYGWWHLVFNYEHGDDVAEWVPPTFDDNAMRRVREELKRRGLADEWVKILCRLLHASSSDGVTWFRIINASLIDQIAASVEVMEEAKK